VRLEGFLAALVASAGLLAYCRGVPCVSLQAVAAVAARAKALGCWVPERDEDAATFRVMMQAAFRRDRLAREADDALLH